MMNPQTSGLIVLGFNNTSTLVGKEIVEEIKERGRDESGTGMKVKKQKK